MKSSLINPKQPLDFFKILITGFEIVLGLLFVLHTMIMMFMLLLSAGFGSFLISGQLLIMFGGLALIVTLARHEKTMLFPPITKFAIGILLILLTAINSYYGVGYIDYFFTRGFLRRDSSLYLILVVFVITSCASLWYFLYQKFPRKSVIAIHAFLTILFVAFFVLQVTNVRKHQVLVLEAYQEFGLAIKQGKYEMAYQLMSPHYRQKETVDDLINSEFFLTYATEEIDSMYAVEYNIWTNNAYIIVDPGFTPSLWDRPDGGISLDFDYIDGKWSLNGQTSFYLNE